MFLSNYHTHSQFCDGRANAEILIDEAIAKNFTTLGFSSHSPVPFPSNWNMQPENIDAYLNYFDLMSNKHGDAITILKGLEVDFIPNIVGAQDSMITSRKFDYLISSIHYLDQFEDGNFWTIDGTKEQFDEGFSHFYKKDKELLVKRFIDISQLMIDGGGFDIIGHIDKIYQHGCRFFDVKDQWYRAMMTILFEKVAEKNLIVEINTKSLSRLGFLYPHISFFPILKSLGIRVTINSDTHESGKIDDGFVYAAECLKKHNITVTTEFIDGVWQPQEIIL